MKPVVGRVADIGGVEHASRLSCTARARRSIARHSEPRPVAGCSPRPLRFRSAPRSATEAMRRMTLLLESSQERCAECRLQKTYHHSVKDMCVALYVVADDPESCSRRNAISKEEGHGRTPVTARLQHSARVDDLLADPCSLASARASFNAHAGELFLSPI